MNYEKKHVNSHTCSFFGEIKEEEITQEFYEWLRLILEDFIRIKKVKTFYTTSHTEFDFVCESIILFLQHKYPDVLLIKCASKKYKTKSIDNRYSDVVCCDTGNYIDRCSYVAQISEYILFDTIRCTGVTGEAAMCHMINARDIAIGRIDLMAFIDRYDKTVDDARKQSEELLEKLMKKGE